MSRSVIGDFMSTRPSQPLFRQPERARAKRDGAATGDVNITGDNETITPFAPLHGAGVERTGLNVLAASGCVLAVLVGGDHGQQS